MFIDVALKLLQRCGRSTVSIFAHESGSRRKAGTKICEHMRRRINSMWVANRQPNDVAIDEFWDRTKRIEIIVVKSWTWVIHAQLDVYTEMSKRTWYLMRKCCSRAKMVTSYQSARPFVLRWYDIVIEFFGFRIWQKIAKNELTSWLPLSVNEWSGPNGTTQ